MKIIAVRFRARLALGVLLFLSFLGRASGQSDYTVEAVQNGGAITGTVKWSGTVPKAPRLPITKDSSVCDPESHKVRDLERLLIASDGSVANTVVFLKDVSKGKAMDLPDTRQHLDQKNCRYVPHIMIIPQGGNLEAKSSDPVLHTVHMTGAASNNIPFPMQNQFIPINLPRSGVVELKCNAGHVWMNAEIMIVKNPYYAVTDEHGFFKLTDVPPGEYEIEAWHEGWQNMSEESVLDVAAQVRVKRPVYSPPQTWAKKVNVKPGETAEVDFAIGAK
jgi:hypothetical protein